MKISKLEKTANLLKNSVTLTIEIEVPALDGYTGLDLFPDDKIADLLVAAGLQYGKNNKIKSKSK